ncbi:MAG: cytochrome c biogenesis protein [Thermoguttaceae bacterium]
MVFAQGWSSWRELPVFDGGRAMPLSTFARHVVADVCGTETPFIAVDDTTLDELLAYADERDRIEAEQRAAEEDAKQPDQGDPSSAAARNLLTMGEAQENPRSIDTLLGEHGVFGRPSDADDSTAATPFDADAASARARLTTGPTGRTARRIVSRIRSMFPSGGRTMEPHEILLSWLVEPEVWHYIPFLPVGDAAICDELFSLGQRNRSGFPLTRVSPYHVTLSEPFRQRLDLIEGSGPAYVRSATDEVVMALNDQYAIFAGIRLDPLRERPETTLALLQRLHPNDNAAGGSFDRWVQAWQILSAGGSGTSETATPITPRSIETVARTLPLMLNAYDRKDETGQHTAVDFAELQQRFDDVLKAIDAAADEATRIQQAIYSTSGPESDVPVWMKSLVPKSLTAVQRRERLLASIELLTSVRQMRREVEAAWLALYDSGHTVRVFPITSGTDLLTQRVEQLTSPWLSLTALVYGHPLFLKRFVEPQLNANDVSTLASTTSVSTDEKTATDENTIEDVVVIPEPVTPSRPDESPLVNVRRNWDEVVRTFSMTSPDSQLAVTRRQRALADLAASIRVASDKLEPVRKTVAGADDTLLRKTAYPPASLMAMEVRYEDLAPFFWMVVAASAAIVAVFVAWLCGVVRREMIDATASDRDTPATQQWLANRFTWEEAAVWLAVVCLVSAAAITAVGGGMRAAITGWAPATNMYETIILMAWVTTLLGIYFPLAPLLSPPFVAAWDVAAFPTRRQIAARFGGKVTANEKRFLTTKLVIGIVRVVVAMAVFYGVIRFGFSSVDAGTGHTASPWTELASLWQTLDLIDAATVVLTIAGIVWIVPRLILAFVIVPYFIVLPDRFLLPFDIDEAIRPQAVPLQQHHRLSRFLTGSRSDDELSGEQKTVVQKTSLAPLWFREVRTMLVDRKWFIAIPAIIVVVAGVVAMVRSEFNPSIRPLTAVLRSNFWLTVHVIAIMASYSAALIAWGLSLASVVAATTMRYSRSGETERPQLPSVCTAVAPLILQMMRVAVVLLALGIVLGGRWADYSWGRFWGWDPKEVWALITMLYYAIILHGRAMRLYGDFGLAIGGVLGSIPVVTTWYGINYVFRTGMHAYAGGNASGATFFLYSFIGVHVVLVLVAISRYLAEVSASSRVVSE